MASASPPHTQNVPPMVAPGVRGPRFALPSTTRRTLDLADLGGRPVVLAFYPGDWEPEAAEQLALYQHFLPNLRVLGATLLGIATDSIWCHLAFARQLRLEFPLLADFEPKGAVARAYGVYRSGVGTCERALFVLDGGGTIRWCYVAPEHIDPGVD